MCKRLDLPWVVHAKLKHGTWVHGAHAQQGQWHTHCIVEVANRCQTSLSLPGLQNTGQHLSHGGFAVAACHSYDTQAQFMPPCFGEHTQSFPRIRDLNA